MHSCLFGVCSRRSVCKDQAPTQAHVCMHAQYIRTRIGMHIEDSVLKYTCHYNIHHIKSATYSVAAQQLVVVLIKEAVNVSLLQ